MINQNNYSREFLKLEKELKSFIFRLLSNRHDTEDIYQDTYIKVQQYLSSFRGESSFKTWVFTIALNLSRNHLKKQQRWLADAQDHGAKLHKDSARHWESLKQVFESTPDKNYEIKEHIAYCFNCINKTLEINQQICLLLKEVYAFKVAEISGITGLTEGVVKHAILDARKHMARIFDDRCAFVSKKGVCHQCTTLKGLLNPKQDAHAEALKIKMVKEGANPDKQYLLDLRMDLVKNIDPLNAPNTLLTTYMLENNEKWVQESQEKKF